MNAFKAATLVCGLMATILLGAGRARQRDATAATPQAETINDRDYGVVEYADMKYPGFALQANVGGVVVVRAKLDDDGNVIEAVALSGNDLLMSDAVSNVRQWRFIPNRQKAVIIVYNFVIEGGCKNVGGQLVLLRNFATIRGCGLPIHVQYATPGK